MSQFQSVFLPNMKDNEDETEVRKMGQDILVKLNQLGSAMPTLLLNVLDSAPSSNVTVTLSKAPGFYTVYIPDSFLIAQTGGPYTVTLTTGVGDTVSIPIAPSGETITSGNLVFTIYVDSSGNVSSEAWNILGSNSSGPYIEVIGGIKFTPFIEDTRATTGTVDRTETVNALSVGQTSIINWACGVTGGITRTITFKMPAGGTYLINLVANGGAFATGTFGVAGANIVGGPLTVAGGSSFNLGVGSGQSAIFSGPVKRIS